MIYYNIGLISDIPIGNNNAALTRLLLRSENATTLLKKKGLTRRETQALR